MSNAILSASVSPPGFCVSRRPSTSHRCYRARRPLSVVPRAATDDDTPNDSVVEPTSDPVITDNVPKKQKGLGKGVNLFDPAATASRFITRRFGFTGGLVFVGLLASVEGREIVGALLEKDEDVVNGVETTTGDFVGVHLVIANAETGQTYLDTKANKKPIAFTFQNKQTFAPNCVGLEEAVSTMKRGGVRVVVVPSELAYGANGAVFANGARVPPNTALKITVSVEDISPSYL